MTKYEQDILDRIEDLIRDKKLTNDFLVSNLQLSIDYLGLTRIEEYSKQIGKSNWGVRKYQSDKIIKVCNYQLIINND